MTRTVEEVARMLGNEHLDGDSDLQKVLWSPHEAEVRLVEITTAFAQDAQQDELLPFRFAPHPPKVPFPTVVAMVGTGLGKQIEDGTSPLPEGWAPLQRICGRFQIPEPSPKATEIAALLERLVVAHEQVPGKLDRIALALKKLSAEPALRPGEVVTSDYKEKGPLYRIMEAIYNTRGDG